jgi:hypothetical protein
MDLGNSTNDEGENVILIDQDNDNEVDGAMCMCVARHGIG